MKSLHEGGVNEPRKITKISQLGQVQERISPSSVGEFRCRVAQNDGANLLFAAVPKLLQTDFRVSSKPIRGIPLKNTPPYAQPANDKGGYSYMVGSDPKIFRLRRAKNRVFGVFRVKNFPPAAGL